MVNKVNGNRRMEDCFQLPPAGGDMDYLKQLGVDECELSDDPGKFYVDVSLENNPEALLDAQLGASLRRRHFVHRPYKDSEIDRLDVADLLRDTADGGRGTAVAVTEREGRLAGRQLQTTEDDVERILLEDIKQLFPRKLDESPSRKPSAFRNVTTSSGTAHMVSGSSRFTATREKHTTKVRDKATMPASIFSKTKSTAGIPGQAVAHNMSYMAMCYPKRTKCSKKVPQSRRGCLRSIQRRRSEDNDESTDDSDNHLLIPDIPLQHLLERMTSTEIQRSDVNSVCTPDGSSSSRRTNTSGVDRTTQTDSSAIHIHSLSNDALTYTSGVILTPDLQLKPATTFEEKHRCNGVVLSGTDSMRHLVEYVNDEVEESLSWEDYHEDYQEDYHEDPVLQTARAGHMQLLRELISADPPRLTDVCDAEGNTALHLACGNGHVACVRFLWEACGDLTTRTNHAGLTPAMMAVKRGEIEALDWVVDQFDPGRTGCDAENRGMGEVIPDGVRSLLLMAADLGQDGCLRLLLDKCGRNRPAEDFTDAYGNTLAHMAARRGHLSCLQTLVESGMSVTDTNQYDITPLQCADSANRRLCVGYLTLVDACVELAAQREAVTHDREHGASANPDGFSRHVVNGNACCKNNADIDDSGNYSSVNSEVDVRFRNETRSRTTHIPLPNDKKCAKVQDMIRKTLGDTCRRLRTITMKTSTGKRTKKPARLCRLRTPDGASSHTIANIRRISGEGRSLDSSRNSRVSDQSDRVDEDSATLRCLDGVLESTPVVSSSELCLESDSELKEGVASTPRLFSTDESCGITAEKVSVNPQYPPHLSPTDVEPCFSQLLLRSSDDESYSNKLRLSPIMWHSGNFGHSTDLDGEPNDANVPQENHGPQPTKIIFTKSDFRETYNRDCPVPNAREY